MAQNFAPLLDSLLGVVLIGAGVAVHFRKRLLIREPRRRFLIRRRTLYRLAAVVLVAGGIGLLAEAWLIAGDPVEAETAATMPSVATTVAASPPEPVPVEQLAPVTRKTLLLFWGTPADDDSVDEQATLAYARALADSVAASLPRRVPGLGAIAQPITQDEWKSLLKDAEQSRARCESEDVDLLAAVSVGALRLEGGIGYATWREPDYLVVDCRTGETRRRRGHVNERMGDRVPYEQGLSDELRDLMADAPATP
jgi:hypothetical protein